MVGQQSKIILKSLTLQNNIQSKTAYLINIFLKWQAIRNYN